MTSALDHHNVRHRVYSIEGRSDFRWCYCGTALHGSVLVYYDKPVTCLICMAQDKPLIDLDSVPGQVGSSQSLRAYIDQKFEHDNSAGDTINVSYTVK